MHETHKATVWQNVEFVTVGAGGARAHHGTLNDEVNALSLISLLLNGCLCHPTLYQTKRKDDFVSF